MLALVLRIKASVFTTVNCRRAAAKLQKLFQIGKKVNVYVGEPVDVSYILNKWKQVCVNHIIYSSTIATLNL
jgi:hypothetical protein